MSPDPRETLRNLIAEKIHAHECGCDLPVDRRSRWDDSTAVTDAMLELFPDVQVESLHITESGGWTVPAEMGGATTHTRLVLCTAPQPVAPRR